MANYICTMRTNYFRVTDEKRFYEIMSRAVSEDDIDIFDRVSDNGTKYYGFGSYGYIEYPADPDRPHTDLDEVFDDEDDDEDDEYTFDALCVALQEVIPEGEAVIIMESGYEKLRYVTGYCTVITRNDIKCIDMVTRAIVLAGEMLGNPEFQTVTEY